MGVQKMAVGRDFDELMAKYKAGERNVSVTSSVMGRRTCEASRHPSQG
jgi:hypothetical protein